MALAQSGKGLGHHFMSLRISASVVVYFSICSWLAICDGWHEVVLMPGSALAKVLQALAMATSFFYLLVRIAI
jgi:hypothetical protein